LVRWAPTDDWAISLASARILTRLSDNGPSRISDLDELENCTHPAITNHVKRLDAANLVSRRTNPTDARAWVIELTETGVGQLHGMRNSFGTDLEPYLATLTSRDQKALRNSCIFLLCLWLLSPGTRRWVLVDAAGREAQLAPDRFRGIWSGR
jgi:DNA-binding MarR family transcriptional regulator